MNKHVKSPCCNASVRRYGKRRRQCMQCKETWRIRQKKRGRKRNRTSASLLSATLQRRETLTQRSGRSQLSAAVLQKRHRYQLDQCMKHDRRMVIPSGKLVLVLDGVWFQFKNYERWTIYLLALRSVNGSIATFLDPIALPRRENLSHWEYVCDQIPPRLRKQVVAVVADGFRGIETIAARYGWVLQRCHFHLIAELQRMRGNGKRVQNKEIRETLYRLIRTALEETDSHRLASLVIAITRVSKERECPKWLGMRAREFLRRIDDFRAYLRYPDLNLPSTTNTVESMGRTIRDLVRRSHGFRTPKALRQWVTALIRFHPTRACNKKEILPKKFNQI